MRVIVGLDIGIARCGYCIIKDNEIVRGGVEKPGLLLIERIDNELSSVLSDGDEIVFVFEVPTPYGVTPSNIIVVGANVIVSALQFLSRYNCKVDFLLRQRIKYILLGSTKAKDKFVRDFLMRHWKLDNRDAKRKGLKQDAWAALAAATAYIKVPRREYNEIEAMWNRACMIWVKKDVSLLSDDSALLEELIATGGVC